MKRNSARGALLMKNKNSSLDTDEVEEMEKP
jgi:hypothetical protein